MSGDPSKVRRWQQVNQMIGSARKMQELFPTRSCDPEQLGLWYRRASEALLCGRGGGKAGGWGFGLPGRMGCEVN